MNKMETLKNELKDLNNKHIYLLDLMVYDEILCQSEGDLSDEEFEKLFAIVENAYLKAEDIDLFRIVRYCLKHKDKIENMTTWQILENCY